VKNRPGEGDALAKLGVASAGCAVLRKRLNILSRRWRSDREVKDRAAEGEALSELALPATI
jgi:hypothetical protein